MEMSAGAFDMIITTNTRITNCSPWKTILLIQAGIFLVTTVISCAPIITYTDYDKSTNFSTYKTFDLLPNEQPDLVNLPLDKTALDTIILDAMLADLTSKGLIQTKANPDLLLSYYIVTNAKTDIYYVNDYYSTIGVPARSSTRDSQRINETTYEQGILIIDIVDAKSKERIWRGRSESRVGIYKDKDKIKQRVLKAVRIILDQFPPG